MEIGKDILEAILNGVREIIVKEVKGDLENLKERVSLLEVSITVFKSALNSMGTAIQTLACRIANLERSYQLLREEMNRRFDQQDAKIESLRDEMHEEVKSLRVDMNRRFELQGEKLDSLNDKMHNLAIDVAKALNTKRFIEDVLERINRLEDKVYR